MYYLLDSEYALRSWADAPYALICKNRALPIFLKAEDYSKLALCDGRHDMAEDDGLMRLTARGFIRPCTEGEPLLDRQYPIFYLNRCVPQIYLMITERCNLNCLHCFNASDNNAASAEMPYEKCERLMNEAAECGVQGVWITGGEPMIHPRFWDIFELIYRREMFVPVLVTNGMFLTEDKLDRFASIGFRGQFIVSYDGVGYHDIMRRHVGADETVLGAIRRVLDRDMDLLINLNLNHDNEDMLEESLALLDDLGVKTVRVIRTVETPRWAMNAGKAAMTPGEYYDRCLVSMERYMKSDASHRMRVYYREFAMLDPQSRSYQLRPVFFEDEDYNPDALSCALARSRIAIGANGDVYPCLQASGELGARDISFGNVFKDGLTKQLTESRFLELVCIPVHERQKENDECGRCEYFRQCLGGCRMQAMLTSGTVYGPDRIRCQFFKNDYKSRIIKLCEENGYTRIGRGRRYG